MLFYPIEKEARIAREIAVYTRQYEKAKRLAARAYAQELADCAEWYEKSKELIRSVKL